MTATPATQEMEVATPTIQSQLRLLSIDHGSIACFLFLLK